MRLGERHTRQVHALSPSCRTPPVIIGTIRFERSFLPISNW